MDEVFVDTSAWYPIVTQRGAFEQCTPRKRRRQPLAHALCQSAVFHGRRRELRDQAERGTHAALTLDRHFAIAGFQMVTDLASTPTGAA